MTEPTLPIVSRARRANRRSRGRFLDGHAPRRFSERERLILEALERRQVMAAVPTVAFSGVTADPFIGTQNSFTLRFDNAGAAESDVGYAPYVDLFMPVTGNDGVSPGTPAVNAYDGIDLVSATYLGAALKTTAVTLVAGGTGVAHPFAKDSNGNPVMLKLSDFPGAKVGDKVYVLELPLGSYTPSQPPVDISVTTAVSNLADVGVGLPLRARGGFRYGGDPLDNPTADPTIIGAAASQAITPTLFRVVKENLAHENETATGPNFHQHYRVSIDVAPGQTITNVTLKDVLPGTLQFVGATVTGGGTVTIVNTPSTSTPGGTLERLLSSVVGTASDVDASMDIEYFVPQQDASSAAILDANTGDDVTINNTAEASGGSWTPLDMRDAVVNPLPTQIATAPPLAAKSIATQKTVSGSGLPGSLLTYTINFQVSDFFAFEDLVLTDLLGDGQRLEGTPTLAVRDGHITPSATTSGTFATANFTNTLNKTGTNGKDEIVFRVSDELVTRGFSPNGRLVGGLVPSGGGVVPGPDVGGTTGTITFTARVQDRYDGTVPSGNTQLVPNDLLDNTATIAGNLLDVLTLDPNGSAEEDGTSASIRVPPSTLAKSVYAKNGSSAGQPLPATTLVTAGDTITYRLRYTLPNSSTEALELTDYLPLPLFDVDDAGTAITAFDAAASGTGNAPAAGKWTYGPADTYRLINPTQPTVTNSSAPNSVVFDFGTFDDPQNRSSTIDILFTVQASNRPFADGLKLANRATSATTNSSLDPSTFDAIAEVTSSEPDLRITKGIVATDNPRGVFSPATKGPVTFNAPGTTGSRFTGAINSTNLAASPVNSNLAEVDANDLVTYCIVIENRGSGRFGAFDTLIQDRPPAGTEIPNVGVQGINLRVTDGAGNPLAFTSVGTGLFEPNGGIRLDDPSSTQGAIRRGVTEAGATVTDGSNIVVITYDMRLLENNVLAKLRNTAAVTEYSATEGGPDFTGSGEISDPAVITIATDNLLNKQLVSTEFVNAINALNEAVIGELVTYNVTITVPEAIMPNAVLTDTLDSRLAFVGIDSVTTSPGVSLTGSTTPVVTNSGGKLTFNLGSITNSDRDNATQETITFVYKAVVLNKANAQGGDQVRNRAALSFDGLDNPRVKQAAAVTIIEPQVRVTKSAVFDDLNPTGDADDPLTYTIVLSNPAGQQASTADAFDVTFSDALPKKPTGSLIVGNGSATPTFTVTDSAGLVDASLFELVGDDTAGYTLQTKSGATFDMPVGSRTITIEVKGKTPSAGSGLVTPGDVITNTATALWSSLDGAISTPRSSHNGDSVERTGSGTPSYNDYRANASADLRITGVGLDKTVVATSESATTDGNKVVVGEIVRYRLVAVIPETTTNSFKLEDRLPAGLKFLDDGTAKVALVSNGGGITSSTIGAGASVAGDAPVAPSFVIPGAVILGGPAFGDGDDVTFDLGTVVNSDSDADQELAVIEFNAIVTNVMSNQLGTTLTNVVDFVKDGVTSGTSSTNVRVAEPEIQSFAKLAVGSDDVTPAAGPFDAGDTVRYRVDVVAKSGGDNSVAYDTQVLDTLPATESLVPGTVRVFRNGTQILAGFTDSSAAGAADVMIDEIAPGDEIRVLFDVVLSAAVVAGGTVTNTAGLGFTSLPGGGTPSNPTGSLVPGASGASDGERNGVDGPGGPLNDYAATTTFTIDIARPDLQKTIEATSPVETQSNQFDPNRTDFTVGEWVTYRVRATLPEGTTQSLVLSDLLPLNRMKVYSSGGVFQARVVSIGGNISGAALAVGDAGVVNVGAGTVTFDFGTVVNTPDNVVDANDQLVVEIQAQVTKDAANVAGATITNTGRLDYTAGGTPTTITDAVTSDIVEPVLVTTKEIVAGAGTVDSRQVDAGDVVTFRVTVRHDAASTGPAFGVQIADTLPTGLELIASSVIVVTHPNYPSSFYDQPVVTTNVGGDPNAFSVLIDYLDNPANDFALGGDLDKAVIEYQARVTTAVAPGATITNTAEVTFDSLYSDVADSNAEKRSYTSQDPASLTVNSSSIAGFVYVDRNDNGILETGEPRIAGVTVWLIGTDNLGNPVSRSTTTSAVGAYSFTGLRPGSYRLDEQQPAGYGDGRDRVGTQFGGSAAALGQDRISGITIAPGSNTKGLRYNFGEVQESDLALTKTDNTSIYRPGATTTYVITVTNKGPTAVTAARVLDPLPSGVTAASWRRTGVSGGGEVSTGSPASGAGALDTLVDLPVNATVTFEFVATISSSHTGRLINTATVSVPNDFVDRNQGDNTATDIDSQPGLVVGSDTGCSSVAVVRLIDQVTGQDMITPIQPFESGFRGGVRVTTADVDGDGVDEIVAASGPGRPGEIKVYRQDGTPLPAFTSFPFGRGFTRGLEVAAGRFNGDSRDDLAVSGRGEVRMFLSPASAAPVANVPVKSFRPYGAGYTGDISIAAGDFGSFSGGRFVPTTDGLSEIVTGSGVGVRALVRIYDVTGAPTMVRQIQPIAASFTGGVSVSTTRYTTGSLADDGIDDVIVGAGFGGNSVVEAYSGRDGSRLARNTAFAGLARQQAAVHATALTDAAGHTDIYAVQGSGGFTATNGVRKLGTLTGPQVQRNSLAAPLRIAAIRK